jgi:hypothetical protein
VLELTRGQPMVRIGSGIHNAPHGGKVKFTRG